MKRALQYSAVALLLLLIAGIAAPYVRVDQYREQIRAGLERALQRKVEINGDTRLNIFRGPGFSVEKVLIHDDPSITVEPLASVPELQTTVSLRSLWTGRLEFAQVRFVEPSLNMTKAERGTWNVVSLLQGAAAKTTGGFPEVVVSNGRINFKLNDVKSTLYLTGTDLTVSPDREGLDISFSCAPARTDRMGGGYGSFTGRGRWSPSEIDLDIELEKSPVEELLTFARGQSLGLHGLVSSKAKVKGPVSRPTIRGSFEMADVHRWDLIQAHGGTWAMNYSGGFDLATQQFELSAGPKENPNSSLSLKLVVSQLLTQPDWRAEAGVEKMTAAALVEVARHVGTPLPAGLQIDGDVAGTLAYTSSGGMQGQISVANAAFTIEEGPRFRTPEATLIVSGDEVKLLPSKLEGERDAAQLELTYAPFRQELSGRLTARGMRLAHLRNLGVDVPLAARFQGGTWSGRMSYANKTWDASMVVSDATTRVPGIASPVRVLTADVEIAGERLAVRRMRCETSDVEFYGSYVYEPGAASPHQFAVTIPSVGLADIETVLLPTLHRSSGFLARTLRWRSNAPEWLRERRADGLVRIGVLTAGLQQFRRVRSRLVWNGTTVRLTDFSAKLEGAVVSGDVVADLKNSEPAYTLSGDIRNMPWKGGHVDLTGTIESSGTGIAFLANLHAEGKFQARSFAVSPEFAFGTASGAFDFAVSRTGPHVKLSSVEAASGNERFNGEGGTQADGKWLMDLASPTRTLRVSGTVAALKAVAEPKP